MSVVIRQYTRRPERYPAPPGRKCTKGHTDLRGRMRGNGRVTFSCRTCEAIRERKRRGQLRTHERQIGTTINGRLMVSNDSLREHVQRALRMDPDLTMEEIAIRCNYVRKGGQGDVTQIGRALGMVAYSKRNGEHNGYTCTRINEDAAVLIARAIHVDPWEIGL